MYGGVGPRRTGCGHRCEQAGETVQRRGSFYEPGLEEVLKRNVDAGRLRFTSSYEEAAAFADVHFIAVATPQKQGEFAADLKYVDAVIETLAPLLTGPSVIFGKSTVPVGTAARLGARACELAPAGDAVEVAWNPEFLREGYAVQDTLHPDRIGSVSTTIALGAQRRSPATSTVLSSRRRFLS